MEHAQRAVHMLVHFPAEGCLNPYFNGTCSKRHGRRQRNHTSQNTVLILILMEHAQRARMTQQQQSQHRRCLNPYFNGTCSKSLLLSYLPLPLVVLILILMEHAQRAKEFNSIPNKICW